MRGKQGEDSIAERDVVDTGRDPDRDRLSRLLDLHEPEHVHQGKQIETPANPVKTSFLRPLVVKLYASFREGLPGLQTVREQFSAPNSALFPDHLRASEP